MDKVNPYILENGVQMDLNPWELWHLLSLGRIHYCPQCECYHINSEFQEFPDDGWGVIDSALSKRSN